MDLIQERYLVEKAKCDPGAFGSLYDANYQKIFGYILRRTADVHVAQDITSEVLFSALKNISKFRWQGIPFYAWLYRITNNKTATCYAHRNNGQVHLEVGAVKTDQITGSFELIKETWAQAWLVLGNKDWGVQIDLVRGQIVSIEPQGQ